LSLRFGYEPGISNRRDFCEPVTEPVTAAQQR
jgi:hypothetical protein